jgi:putative RecB family exonuclease
MSRFRGSPADTQQLPLDGMPPRLLSCTPTSLLTFEACPRRFRLTYVDRPPAPKGPPWAHNSLGAGVHNALRAWWAEPLARRTPARAGALVSACWLREGWRDEEQSERWRLRAQQMVEAYVSALDPEDAPLALERQVATRTARLAVSGRIDRLDLRDGALVIVDYKTGRRWLTEEDARDSLPLALYAVAAARSYRRECRRVELHHLPSGRVLSWEHDAAGLAMHVARAEHIAGGIVSAGAALADGADADDVYPPRPGARCSWCDVRRHCPQGQAAAPRREPWDALGELP